MFYKKIGLLWSRSKGRVKISAAICPNNNELFKKQLSFVAKLGIVMFTMSKSVIWKDPGQGHSEGLYNQYMTGALYLLQPLKDLWYIDNAL